MSEGRNSLFNSFLRKTNEMPLVDSWLDRRGDWLMDNSKIREYLRPMIQEKKQKIKILSIGSGKGHEIDWLDSVLEGADITGLDPNDFWTKPVQKRLETSGKFGGNTAEYLPPEVRAEDLTGIGDESMDAIVMFFVLHHMDENKHGKTMQEMNRVLRKGGLAFISEDIVENQQERGLTVKQDRLLNAEVSSDNPHNYRSQNEWKEFFERYGFRVKDYNEVQPDKVRNGFFVLEKIEDLEEQKSTI